VAIALPRVALFQHGTLLAMTLVAFSTVHPLIDSRLLSMVLVLMLTTAIVAPVLTEYLAPRMLPY
jgi:hypothetical protein